MRAEARTPACGPGNPLGRACQPACSPKEERLMGWLLLGIFVAALLSLFFSTLTYSLRDYSRPQLADYLERHGKPTWTECTFDRTNDLIVTTAVGRLITNLLILVFVLHTLVD